MKLFIVTGLLGSGKTNVLRTFEDNNYYCIDNLPLSSIFNVISELEANKVRYAAISIDSRSLNFENLQSIIASLSVSLDLNLIYLKANKSEIIKRYSESRRKHPLIKTSLSISEAIDRDELLLKGLINQEAIVIDTTKMNLDNLKNYISKIIDNKHNTHIHLISFAFKNNIPLDLDFMFDVREIKNPYYDKKLKNKTGKSSALDRYFKKIPEVAEYQSQLIRFIKQRITALIKTQRKYIAIGIGCTGGQHRSVYFVEKLAENLKSKKISISILHRDLHG
ncbi:MAG: RNase adapter RapZ [Nitrosomonadales bacterium]